MIFIKNPLPGKVKTRLAREVGNDRALAVYRWLLDITRKAATDVQVNRWLWYSDMVPAHDEWSESDFEKWQQASGHLGERMRAAFRQAFRQNFGPVVIIGSDCPDMSTALIQRAFEELQTNDVVLGPARDGGYYLLGMRRYFDLFHKVPWSTGEVLATTRSQLRALRLGWSELPVRDDLDTAEDLKKTKYYDAPN